MSNLQQSAKNKLSKKQAIILVNGKLSLGLNESNTIFSNVNEGKNVWWFEPDNSKFNENLNLLLNDANRRVLYHFFIPKNDIINPKTIFYQRKDFDNKSQIQIRDNDYNFKDILKSEFSFRKYLKNEIKY